jgi:TPR repeat protein
MIFISSIARAFSRAFVAWAALGAASVGLSGCQLLAAPVVGAMTLANVMDQRSQNRHAKRIWYDERAYVKTLQANGDPLGDYLYAIGNAQGWIKDTRDPVEIVGWLQKAADRGSSDAMIMLGFYYFDAVIPLDGNFKRLSADKVDRVLGEKLVREGVARRCTYAVPSPSGEWVRLEYTSAARWMAMVYRNGMDEKVGPHEYRIVIPKNLALEQEWLDIDVQCRATAFIG